MKGIPIQVAEVFASCPEVARDKLLALRQRILDVARNTIRIGWSEKTPEHYALYVHCQTKVIDQCRGLFPTQLTYQGNRAIIFDLEQTLPEEELDVCIRLALTYHQNKSE